MGVIFIYGIHDRIVNLLVHLYRFCLFSLLCWPAYAWSQIPRQTFSEVQYQQFANKEIDTVKALDAVQVNVYFNKQPILSLPATVSVISQQMLEEQVSQSLVPAINSIPGIRMEERSPGSYRLSIRGSLLRSPYGIRNVKMYMDDFILTDAGGNTYLNALDAGGVSEISILKGPESSIFGANTGGVVLINTGSEIASEVKGSLTAGAYGLFHQKASLQKKWHQAGLNIHQSYQRSDGYRNNSALERKYFQASPVWNYENESSLKALVMYSDIHYQTPGGLTAGQFEANPRSARPASGSTPGAEEQKAGIYSKTLLGGISHETELSKSLRHVISITGSYTDFKNPFITNFETRKEKTVGIRSYLQYAFSRFLPVTLRLGYEGQQTHTDITNSENLGGARGTLQSADQLIAKQQFIFSHASLNLSTRLLLEAALSINYYGYDYGNIDLKKPELETRKFNTEVMPRIAFSYKLTDQAAIRTSASKGYSPPTIAEVRASDNIINTSLQAESGWNYETGIRVSFWNNRLYWDGVVFRFNLNDAIVRRVNDKNAEYFVNAGGTRQSGFESQFQYWVLPIKAGGIIRSLHLKNSYTYSSFAFGSYQSGNENFSGNRITGVPKHVLVTSLNVGLAEKSSLFIQHNFTSSIPLNDSGSSYAKKYHLIQLKASHQVSKSRVGWFFFAGIDNALNADYSLGNDLNAFGDRFFNPAPKRNFFAGLSVVL